MGTDLLLSLKIFHKSQRRYHVNFANSNKKEENVCPVHTYRDGSHKMGCFVFISHDIAFYIDLQGYVLLGLWIPGEGIEVLHNLQMFLVRVWKSYRTHRSSRYCTEVLQNSQKYRVGTWMLCLYSYPHRGILEGVGYRVYTPGTYPIFRVFRLHKGRVRVWGVVPVPRVLWNRTDRSFVYRFKCHI